MKKVLYVIAVFSLLIAAFAQAQMLAPATPSWSTSGFVDGGTYGDANAGGIEGGTYQTYSTGDSDSWLNMESVQTEFGTNTPCSVNCEDSFARIESGFDGHHQSGAFASFSGNVPASSIAGTASFVEFEGHTSIQTVE